MEIWLTLCRERILNGSITGVLANGSLDVAADVAQDGRRKIAVWASGEGAGLPLRKVGHLIGQGCDAGFREGLVAGSIVVLASLDGVDRQIPERICTGAESILAVVEIKAWRLSDPDGGVECREGDVVVACLRSLIYRHCP
jgi:hypothetical protein